jgi:hypothetical protein
VQNLDIGEILSGNGSSQFAWLSHIDGQNILLRSIRVVLTPRGITKRGRSMNLCAYRHADESNYKK